MCILCIEFQKGKMNIREVKNNLRELILVAQYEEEGLDHLEDLYKAVNLTEELEKFKENE